MSAIVTRTPRGATHPLTVGTSIDLGLDTDGGKWSVVCDDHGTCVAVDTRAAAMAVRADDFCGDCQDEAEAAAAAAAAPPVKVKTIKARWWDGDDDYDVHLTPVQDGYWTQVSTTRGIVIGKVRAYSGSIDRKYAGSRLRHPGKTRRFWCTEDLDGNTDYWRKHESMSDAIRSLVDKAASRAIGIR